MNPIKNTSLDDILNIYEDKNHVRYIAYKESQFSPSELQWYHNLENSMELETLVKQFPYVILKYDESTGSIVEDSPHEYNGALTNNFHIAYAKYLDSKASEQYHQIDISSIYNIEKKPNKVADIGFNEKSIIQNPNEGIVIDNDAIPENIEIKPLPKNYHPNRDINGNYMAGPIQHYQQQFIYNPGNTYIPNSHPQYVTQYRTYGYAQDPTDINKHIIRF